MATTPSSSAPPCAKPSDTDPATPAPARPEDAPQGPTAPTPGEGTDTPADEHTRATVIPDGPPPPPRTPLDFSDLDAVRAWLDDVAARVDDLAEAAQDQTDPPAKRFYGRAGARQQIDEAYQTLVDHIAFARAGLPPGGEP